MRVLGVDVETLKARYGSLLAGVGRTPDPERDARFDAVTRPELAQTSLDLYPPRED